MSVFCGIYKALGLAYISLHFVSSSLHVYVI